MIVMRPGLVQLFTALLGALPALQAQTPPVVTGGIITPGALVLYTSDFSQDALGSFPRGLKYLRGPMELVALAGVPMLRSIGPAEFIIPLSAPLPQDFTLEFDLVARNTNCCSGEELAFEGSPQLNRSIGSAWVAWHHQYTGIIGGGQDLGSSTRPFPEDLQQELQGRLGHIQVIVSGTQFKLFTNGRQIYNIPNLVFRRTTVLRIFLGGVDAGTGAVYLARVTLAAGTGAAIAFATPSAAPTQPAAQPPSLPLPPPVAPPTQPPALPPPASVPGTSPVRNAPAIAVGPVATPTSATRNAARCTPGAAAGPGPQQFMAIGIRVGGASLSWDIEPSTEYLLERAPAPAVAPAGGPTWTRLTSTCDPGGNFLPTQGLGEDMIVHHSLTLLDVYPGVRMGAPYQYRLTAIHADGTSGSFTIYWEAQSGRFQANPVATVSGHTVTITTGVSYCSPIPERCDPMALEFMVTNSSTGFSYSTQQSWFDNSDPALPGSEPGTLAFAISGVPPGTHTFTVTALYQPDLKVAAGSVTVQVP